MKRKMKRITAILLSLSTALSCATSVSAREVELGQTVYFRAVPYINPGAGDSSETIDRLYNEARGNASTSSYDMNGMRDGYVIPDGGWDWADWINSDAWKNPVKNQSPMGSPTSPNGSMPDELSNPNAAHDALSSNMPTIPNTKKGLEGLIDGMSGGKQTGVMSLEDFMKLIGDQNQAIKDKYDKLIEEAKKKQKGDAASAKDIKQKFDDAQNGKNPWTGQPNNPRPSVNDWLNEQFESWKDENGIPDSPADVGDGSGDGSGNDDDDPFPDPLSEWQWFNSSLYRDYVRVGAHSLVPKEQVSDDEAKNMRYIYRGHTVDAEGNQTGLAAEMVAQTSDDYVYFYRNENGTLVSETKDSLLSKYGSMDKAEAKLGPMKSAREYLSGGKSIGDLSPEEKRAFRHAGLTIKDDDGKYLTPSQAMEKYGSYDKMPQSVKDSFDTNGYVRNSMNKMYGEDVPYVEQLEDFFSGFEDPAFAALSGDNWDGPDYPDFSDLTPEEKALFTVYGISYEELTKKLEEEGGIENMNLEQVQSVVAESADKTGRFKREILNTDENFFDSSAITGFGNLGQIIHNANGDYRAVPDVIRQRMTKAEFDRLSAMKTWDLETLKPEDVHWVKTRASTIGTTGWDETGTLKDCWYQCPNCGGFFNTQYACGCGVFNDAEWLEAVNSWDKTLPFGHTGHDDTSIDFDVILPLLSGSGSIDPNSGLYVGSFTGKTVNLGHVHLPIGYTLDALDAAFANSYISDKLPAEWLSWFGDDRRDNLLLAMNPQSPMSMYGIVNLQTGTNEMYTSEDGSPFPSYVLTSGEQAWNIYNPCRIKSDGLFGDGELPDVTDPAGLAQQLIDLGLDDDMDDFIDWLLNQDGGDAGNGPDGNGDNGRKESEEQSKKFDEESEKQSRAQSENIAKLESEKQAALERYRKQIESEYQKYRDSLPKPDDELPEDPSLWTDDDYDEAIRQMNEADQQASGQPKFDDSKIPKIGDTKEYSETDLEKLVEELFGNWPENKGSMKKFYDWLVAKYGDSADSKFLETLRAMYEAGVFNTDDPDMVRKNMRAFINGYNSVTDENGNFAGFVKIYTTASAAYKDIGVKKNTQKVCGNQRYEITYEKPSEVSATHLTNGDHVWAAGPQTGTYTAVGKYDEYNVYYTLGQATVTIEQYAEVFGIKIPIRSRTETVVLEDESGIKRDNRVEKQFYGPETIVVKPGNIDLNKTDFFNTQRIR